jgi:signal transduction histidine kinase
LKIPPGVNRVEIAFTGLHFAAPEKIRFQYRLAGLDERWLELGNRRTAEFGHLPPGDYKFEVKACNADGVWSATSASIAFVKSPFFWQTWWFIIGSTGMVAVASAWALRAVTVQRYNRRMEEIQRQHALEKERTRISHDMHDALGANLSQIALVAGMAHDTNVVPARLVEQMKRVSHLAREVIESVDEIVWAVNPKNDTLNNFVDYICHYATGLLETANLRFRWEAPNELPPCTISSEMRHNLFLAVKEVLNNAIKHARAEEVRIVISLRGNILNIKIRDDGVGTNPPTHRVRGGSGLVSLNERMTKVGGVFAIKSAPASGTEIELAIPVEYVDK